MARKLKTAAAAERRIADDRQVRDTVEAILADVEARGDDAVRGLSIRFDGWDRDSYRLTPAEIEHCVDSLTEQDRKGEQANLRMRRHGGHYVHYAGAAELID